MSVNHQSPFETTPGFFQAQTNTTTWGTGGNTCTITDTKIHPGSRVFAYVTGTTAAAGRWSYTITQGQVVITSSDPENSTLPISYIVI